MSCLWRGGGTDGSGKGIFLDHTDGLGVHTVPKSGYFVPMLSVSPVSLHEVKEFLSWVSWISNETAGPSVDHRCPAVREDLSL